MSEDVARVLGAGAPGVVKIKGKECKLAPLSIRELTEVEREGVKLYRRMYLENLKDSIEFLPNGDEVLREAVEKTAHWGTDDLPKKDVYLTSTIPTSPKLKKWMVENMGITEDRLKVVTTYQRIVASALDGGILSEEIYTKLTGTPVKKAKTGYINWWVTGTKEGMLAMIWQSAKNSGITREEVDSLIDSPTDMMIFSREIEALSVPATGNG